MPHTPTDPSQSEPRSLGVHLEGYLESYTGQGEAARLHLLALRAAGIPVKATTIPVEDVAPGAEAESMAKREAVPPAENEPAENELDVDIICVNGLNLAAHAAARGDPYFRRRPSIGVWAWETDAVPEAMVEAAGLVDEIWVYSQYVADNLRPAVEPTPVAVVPLPAIPPEPGRHPLSLDLPHGFTFLFSFDFFSTLGRKNPSAVIESFVQAFEPGEGPHLVLKTINGGFMWQALEDLRGETQGRPDIHIVDRAMNADEKAALFAACDCYVSLHRSEGYGPPIAEAMALGKPAIATAYSGNREFMTRNNSYLVDYEMTAVGPGNCLYVEGNWAEPDVGQAAGLMRHVWEHPDDARAIGGRARRDLLSRFSPEVVGAIARARVESVAVTPPRRVGAQAGARGSGADAPASESVAQLIGLDPESAAASGGGRLRGFVRRATLRAMRPFTAYQRRLNQALVAEISSLRGELEAERAARRKERSRLRRLEGGLYAGGRGRDAAGPHSEAAPKDRLGPPSAAAISAAAPDSRLTVREQLDRIPDWFHSMDLGDGVLTQGIRSPDELEAELESLRLPDLTGLSVLDIGAWDGYFSFAAEKRGAARVVALDHYSWSIDFQAWNEYLEDCRADGIAALPADQVDGVWKPQEMPGMRGFLLAREALASSVEPVVANFMDLDPADLGSFDVVLFLGVLYHLKDPLPALQRVAELTDRLAVIETEAELVAGTEPQELWRFLEGDDRQADPGNWWSPTMEGLLAMCRAAGFRHAEPVAGPPCAGGDQPQRYRAVVHARK